jgi:hypothetical protein
VDRDEGALLPPPGVADPLKAGRGILPGGYASAGPDEQASLLLLTEHFSDDEDEYCSAKATAQEQIQQGIACCGEYKD